VCSSDLYRDGKNGAISITVIVGDLPESEVAALNDVWFAAASEARQITVLNKQVFTEQGLEPWTSRTPHGIWESALVDGRAQRALLHISVDQLSSHGFPVTYFDHVFFLPDPDGSAPRSASDRSIRAVAEACGGACTVASLDEILKQLT